MKACILYGVHDLRYEDYPEPIITNDEEVVVRVLRGGICGSDMHYYEEGGIGSVIRVREPIIIGHEGVGIVEQAGSMVTTASVGDMVVIRPARPCFHCVYCDKKMFSYCENMRHLGSAALMPHTMGLFSEKVLLHQCQLRVVKDLKPEIGAFVEPLAVAYHGVRNLGDLIGKSVLVMGAGPIGCLCAAAAKAQGAETVTVIDVRQPPLGIALQMGADVVCNSKENPDQIARWKEHKGSFDLMIEASGNRFAVIDGMAMTRPEGIISQVGQFGADQMPDLGLFVVKGFQWRAVMRFYDEFTPATRALERGIINPLPLLSAIYPPEECVEAMKIALSPETAKVQIVINKQ